MFIFKEIVWAKVKGYPWWPAEVIFFEYFRSPNYLPKIKIILEYHSLAKVISNKHLDSFSAHL
jgi:hypothetical protein